MAEEKTEKKHTLIFEPQTGGHRTEFIGHLLEYIRKEKPDGRTYTFVVGKGLAGKKVDLPAGVSLREISPAQEKVLSRASGGLGGFVFFRILGTYLSELNPDHLIIMDLTWLELPLCFHRLSCPFAGILFIQYPELCSGSRPGWKRHLRLWIKEFKTGFFLQKAKPQRIFLLNGSFSCAYLNRHFGVFCYVPIPDPVPPITADSGVQLRREYDIKENRRLFLFFGSMSVRKGVEELVNAIGALSLETAQNSAFIFCGMPEPNYTKRYHKLVDNLIQERPDVCLHLEEQFVPSSRMRALFEQVDWVLMPYTRPEYSSGILVHAAAAATPVIGPSDGLVGRQIREHGLGLDIPLDTLPDAIEKAVEGHHAFDELARQAFVAASHPEKFASTLLEI